MAINFKQIILIGLCMVLIPSAFAMNCNYNPKPLIKDQINWVCYNISGDYCISQVEFNNETIQINPVPKVVEGVGVIDKFEVTNKIVNVYFRKDLLRDQREITFKVICNNETFKANITPQFSAYPQFIDRGSWLQDNMGYIIGWICFIVAILIFLVWAWKQRKRT